MEQYFSDLQRDVGLVAKDVGQGDYNSLKAFAVKRKGLILSIAVPSFLVLRFPAAVAMQVIHAFVHYRDRPSTAAKSLGMKRRGDVVRVVARSGLWVRLDDDGWMLTDGRLIGLGALLANHITDLLPDTLWQATRPCDVVETPGDAQPIATLADGASVAVAAECGDWVRLKTGGWVELDAFLAG